ncbi:MAG TPA: cbb3-type cytochrome c oxidase subunit I [Candidatus Binataceae bacterium]|nr:cbb3-type cytochrome c oxidase subunit I [Candidatus Binataceae bacterium]
MERRGMPISSWWLQGAILTYLVGFCILGILAYLGYQQQPPIPGRVKDANGETLLTRADILDGMNVFQRYGLMEYGTVYGHGAYLGPDFTADYLHREAQFLLQRYFHSAPESAQSRVAAELHANTYDAATDTLTWSDARADAYQSLVEHYQQIFFAAHPAAGLQAHSIPNPDEIRKLAGFFAWTAWTAAANRPGHDYSYTNNWPSEPLAGNQVTADAVTWSAISIIFLLGGTGLVLFFFGRYDWLGWTEERRPLRFLPVEDFAPTAAQRAVVWFLLVSSVLFLIQTLVGGLAAHYRAEPAASFGVDISHWLPYNLVRTWHVQLAIFWVTASFLATGIFIAPLIAGGEPRGQAALTIVLLVAVVIVVFGSLAGEYASIRGWLNHWWFWIGDQGFEYLDLGRLWQVALIAGLVLWVFILWRGLRGALAAERHGNLPWLLFYAALAIPAFYAAGLLVDRRGGFAIADFWRFWVVHLWVEDFLELFTTVVVAYLFVLLGMVSERTAVRVIYLDIILYSTGGVVGTMHHLYFSGMPAAHMALGAAFSAMEVIPLLMLTLEAWAFVRSGERAIAGGGGPAQHPHRWAVWFLVATGFWNFLGAGVFGFLINLPVVSYYEIGTGLTANHAHTSMMGVYGMLAIGLLLFCLRYLMRPEAWSDRAAQVSFLSLNIGLGWMAFCNLFPVGIFQLYDAVAVGYWHARAPEFIAMPWVHLLEWLRLPGDVLFIAGGAVPLLYLCVLALRYPNPRRAAAGQAPAAHLFTVERAA